MSDRIVVMREGRISGRVARGRGDRGADHAPRHRDAVVTKLHRLAWSTIAAGRSACFPDGQAGHRGRRGCDPSRDPALGVDGRPRHVGPRAAYRARPDRLAPRDADRARGPVVDDRHRVNAGPGGWYRHLAVRSSPDIVEVVEAAAAAGPDRGRDHVPPPRSPSPRSWSCRSAARAVRCRNEVVRGCRRRIGPSSRAWRPLSRRGSVGFQRPSRPSSISAGVGWRAASSTSSPHPLGPSSSPAATTSQPPSRSPSSSGDVRMFADGSLDGRPRARSGRPGGRMSRSLPSGRTGRSAAASTGLERCAPTGRSMDRGRQETPSTWTTSGSSTAPAAPRPAT